MIIRTLHVCYSFPPDPPGGTELYVRALGRELRALGLGVVIAAPGVRNETYEMDGLRVRRFAHGTHRDLTELYTGDPTAATNVARLLEEESPDVVHMHALTPACSTEIARMSRKRGSGVVFTYHTPTVSCQRGTLMEGGRAPCDGRMEVARCTACALDGLGVGGPAGDLLARVPTRMGDWIGTMGLQGGAWTALRMSDLVARRQQEVSDLFRVTDVLVALTPWTRALFMANGVSESKIVVVPHGITFSSHVGGTRPRDGRLRIAHLGRLDPVKGTGLLLRALRGMPDSPIALDVYGIVQNDLESSRLESLQSEAGSDGRIRFLAPIPPDDVVTRLNDYDMVAVPSQWMETGPLVVLEAFAAGRPVLGSALGGIADRVQDGVNGVLVTPHDSLEAWQQALRRCADDRGLIEQLTAGVVPPRTMADVAREMDDIYRRVAVPARAATD